MRGDGTLIDPTCHAEAMANFFYCLHLNFGVSTTDTIQQFGRKRKDMFEGKRVKKQGGGKQGDPSALYRHILRNTSLKSTEPKERTVSKEPTVVQKKLLSTLYYLQRRLIWPVAMQVRGSRQGWSLGPLPPCVSFRAL